MKFVMTSTGMQEFKNPISLLEMPFNAIKDNAQEIAYDFTQDAIIGVLIAFRDFFVDSISAITLIGGGICILLRVAGWDSGYKCAGILFVVNILFKMLLGG